MNKARFEMYISQYMYYNSYREFLEICVSNIQCTKIEMLYTIKLH